MSDLFKPGDFLIFQIESGFGLLRVLGINRSENENVWHLAAYSDLFIDIDFAESAIKSPKNLTVSIPHTALTDRAFTSTQVSRLGYSELTDAELLPYSDWEKGTEQDISDRSIRLLLGLR